MAAQADPAASAIGGSTPFGNFFAGLPGIMQGMFGNSGAPFEKGMDAYKPYFDEAKGYQNPFFSAGTSAIPQYQDWTKSMSNPSDFINTLMSKYQQSPWSKFQQDQNIRTSNNLGSATGLTGSTPLQMQAQQNSNNLSGEDMNQWLQNVLGVNTQYGSALGNQVGMGQNAGNSLSTLANNAGTNAGQAAYGEEAGKQQDSSALWNGIAKMFGG
jgi:hypothetical protein